MEDGKTKSKDEVENVERKRLMKWISGGIERERKRGMDLYRVSQNYRIPSSGLSWGHPVDQVKMFKKKLRSL
jgi:hypothetical protein